MDKPPAYNDLPVGPASAPLMADHKGDHNQQMSNLGWNLGDHEYQDKNQDKSPYPQFPSMPPPIIQQPSMNQQMFPPMQQQMIPQKEVMNQQMMPQMHQQMIPQQQVQQQMAPQQIVIINQNLHVETRPIVMFCPHCHQQAVTRIDNTTNCGTHCVAASMCCVGLIPCAIIPYVTNYYKDAVHKCPLCNGYIGTYRRSKHRYYRRRNECSIM